MKLWITCGFACGFAAFSSSHADPYRAQMSAPAMQNAGDGHLRGVYDSLNALRHSQGNHEAELKQFDEKFQNLELIIESLRRQLQESSKGHKELLGASSATLSVKMSDLEVVSRSLIADLQQIKTHVNETSATLQKRLLDLERISEEQSQYIEHLQGALKSLMELLQANDSVISSPQIYQVKSGDSLGEIAVQLGTTVKAIKEANDLKTDRIFINQKLKIPEK